MVAFSSDVTCFHDQVFRQQPLCVEIPLLDIRIHVIRKIAFADGLSERGILSAEWAFLGAIRCAEPIGKGISQVVYYSAVVGSGQFAGCAAEALESSFAVDCLRV